MQCPRCSVPLTDLQRAEDPGGGPYRCPQYQNTGDIGCPKCGGQWIPYEHLKNQLVQITKLGYRKPWHNRLAAVGWLLKTNQQALQMAEELRLPCPVCQCLMEKVRSRTNKMLLYDYCSRCKGTWLDPGELERLAAALKRAPFQGSWVDR